MFKILRYIQKKYYQYTTENYKFKITNYPNSEVQVFIGKHTMT